MSCAFRRVPSQWGKLPRPISTASYSRCATTYSIPRCAPSTSRTLEALLPRETVTRSFHSSRITYRDEHDEKARNLNQKGLDEAEQEVRVKQNQVKRPWLRENADKPPAEAPPQESPNAKGLYPSSHLGIPHIQQPQLIRSPPSRQAPHHSNSPPQAHRPFTHPRRKGQRKQRFRRLRTRPLHQ